MVFTIFIVTDMIQVRTITNLVIKPFPFCIALKVISDIEFKEKYILVTKAAWKKLF